MIVLSPPSLLSGAIGVGNIWTASQTFNDNVKLILGTGADAELYYDGTNLVLNPQAVGSGIVSVLGNVSLGGSSYTLSMQYWSLGANYIATGNEDTYALLMQARDSGVALVEIARLQGAADPYIQIGRDDTGVALNAVTDMLVLQAGGGTGNEAANFGLGISLKIGNAASEVEERGSLDLVLQTATNAAEDASWILRAMVAGAMATVLSAGGYAGVAKLGFYATAPVALQTGVAVTAGGIHAALVNLGLITA